MYIIIPAINTFNQGGIKNWNNGKHSSFSNEICIFLINFRFTNYSSVEGLKRRCDEDEMCCDPCCDPVWCAFMYVVYVCVYACVITLGGK